MVSQYSQVGPCSQPEARPAMAELCPNTQAPGPSPPGPSGAPLPSHPLRGVPQDPPGPAPVPVCRAGVMTAGPGGCSPPTALRVTVSPKPPTSQPPPNPHTEVRGCWVSWASPAPSLRPAWPLGKQEAAPLSSSPSGWEECVWTVTVPGTCAIWWVVNAPSTTRQPGCADIQHRPETSFLRVGNADRLCRHLPRHLGDPQGRGRSLATQAGTEGRPRSSRPIALGPWAACPPLGPGSRLPRFQAPTW